MADTPVNLKNTPTPVSRNRSLSCPECDQLWNRCQCSTRKIDVTDSLLGSVEAASQPESEDTPDNFKGSIVAGKYEVIDCLGEGGMGGVFLTEHVSLKKKFALKILRKGLVEDEFLVERLRREAQACAMLAHPNIVSVFDFGVTDNGFPFIVMEYLEGQDLAHIIDQKTQMDLTRVMKLVIQLCDGLGYAHQKGVIHRDLKPTNVIVTNPGTESETLKVVDFGIAKMDLPGGEMQHLTQTGEVLGSPAYMSPEQIQGQKIDQRSDIYSLGCIIFELLTGKQLFRGHTMFATLEANLHQSPPEIELKPGDDPLKKKLYEIMERCLAKDREDRYESLIAVKQEILQLSKAPPENRLAGRIPILSSFIFLGIIISMMAYIVSIKASAGDAVRVKENLVAKVNSFEDLFVGRIYDLGASDEAAKQEFMKVITSSKDVNARLAASIEFMKRSREDLAKTRPSELPKLIEDVGSVKNRAVRWIEESIEDDSVSLNKYIAAHVLYEYAEALEDAVPLSKKRYIASHGGGNDTIGLVKKSPELKQLYDKILKGFQKAIEILELETREGMILADYYAELADSQDDIGMFEPAIKNIKHAISLAEKDGRCDVYYLVKWRCKLADALIDSGRREKAKEQYIALVNLANKQVLSKSSMDRIKSLERKLRKTQNAI